MIAVGLANTVTKPLPETKPKLVASEKEVSV